MNEFKDSMIHGNLEIGDTIRSKINVVGPPLFLSTSNSSDFSNLWDDTNSTHTSLECIKLRDNFHSYVCVNNDNDTEDQRYFIVLPKASLLPLNTRLYISITNNISEYIYVYGYCDDGDPSNIEHMIIEGEGFRGVVRIGPTYGFLELSVSLYRYENERPHVWHVLDGHYGGYDATGLI